MPRQSANKPLAHCRSGLTLIESVVVIAIIGVLAGLTILGVGAAREASRRMSCQNNLKQIGLALNAYEATHHRFPALITSESAASPFFWLLPHIEQQGQYDEIMKNYPELYSGPVVNEAGRVPDEKPLPAYQCPSDPLVGGTNYRLNTGTGLLSMGQEIDLSGGLRLRHKGNGFFQGRALGAAEVRDGLSNTIAISERCRSDRSRSNYEADFLQLDWQWGANNTPENYFARCAAASPSEYPIHRVGGSSWFAIGHSFTYYNHIATPAQLDLDCLHQLWVTTTYRPGVVRATSYHNKSVNCLMGDGAVRLISYNVNSITWRALGTRDAGDSPAE